MTPYYPCMTFKPSDALHSGLGFFSYQSWWPQGIVKVFDLTPAWPLTPAMSYTLIRGSSYQIWWPYSISKPFDLWLNPDDPCMTFDASNALHSGQGFFPPNLVAIGIAEQIDPYLNPADAYMIFDLSNALYSGQGFFPPNLVAIGHC